MVQRIRDKKVHLLLLFTLTLWQIKIAIRKTAYYSSIITGDIM
jgi:hypothetical protein